MCVCVCIPTVNQVYEEDKKKREAGGAEYYVDCFKTGENFLGFFKARVGERERKRERERA